MKKLLLFSLILITSIGFAQKRISGRVIDAENNPLIGAAVYINNTSIGTTTDDKGEFELTLKKGVHNIIVSYLGFETLQYSLDIDKYEKPLVFKLAQKANVLDEVVISSKRKKMSAEDRAYFLRQFKRNFLGKTNLSKECKILNEKAIELYYDNTTNTLEASVTEPLKIRNEGLGYLITYDLVHYKQTSQLFSYLGYTRYENLKGSKRKQRKWKERRKVAYNGSTMHFFRSIIAGNLKKEGFVVNQFKQIPNPRRPSDSIIRLARRTLRNLSSGDSNVDFKFYSTKDLKIKANRDEVLDKMAKNGAGQIRGIDIEQIKNSDFIVKQNDDGTYEARTKTSHIQVRDSLRRILRKSSLKRFVNVFIKKDLSNKDFILEKNGLHNLVFSNYLQIKYMNEKEEDNFRPGPARLDHQVSSISLYVKETPFDKVGALFRPLDMFMDGYWGYEKLADALPLDYNLKE